MKLLLVCTSGGHFSTMNSLQEFWSVHDRVWATDNRGNTQTLMGRERVYWLPYQAPRDLLALLKNLPVTLKILTQEQPDIVISTGASLAINFAVAAKLLRKRFIFIESLSRSEKLSLSGKVVYFLADEFYVQWPTLADKLPKAVFKGTVV
ncbi:UDP-N-acetylglucosamine--LPS N-acetylglucosamine transferase [bacterium]|nr:UDP-N-acetylglucosamine--LPS N-acetylglucosamine transferase [bacterium]